MGSWDDSTRVMQLRMRLSSALKVWCTQLPYETRSNWKPLVHVFKTEWCRPVGSKEERYYGMEMRDPETPRMFLYRLNKATKSAGIRFEKTVSEREAHIRRFIHALSDNRLKTTLQGQGFENMVKLKKELEAD
ncbi:hypothetical protein PHMEG_00026514 [Phytophthora megakarya]|uniref:Uncharacterized protein n=1 Tax=Phytophthora megakarya TaxID=4795 RepID=A0A225V891_9STRA|nr:hypothetical protein PHMEG_00026514 [Phytophthora megakarya]